MLVDALLHDVNRFLEPSALVVSHDLRCHAELLDADDAELLGGNSLLAHRRRGAPLPLSLNLIQLPKDLGVGELEGGIRGGIPKSTVLILDVSNPTGLLTNNSIQVAGIQDLREREVWNQQGIEKQDI